MKTNLLLFFVCILLFSCTQPAPPPETPPAGHALIVGGGESHDYDRWFNQEDTQTLIDAGWTASYTDDVSTIRDNLDAADVLILTNNQPIPDSLTRQAIFDYVDNGKGLLLIHPALWYNWNDWPIYNKELAGGGSRSHGPYGAFEITVTQPEHPIVQGMDPVFTLEDELYRFEMDSEGPELNVLATGAEPDTGTEYPVIWTVVHPSRNIVGITLGHDSFTHESSNYKSLLINSVNYLLR